MAALGPLAVAAGALGLVAVIIVGRRRGALALARGRGASAGQLLAAQLWEGLLITVPAALVGFLLAQAAVPSRPAAASSIGAIFVALAVTALLLVATWPVARRARRDLERAEAPARRLSPRRLVIEATIVGIAVAAAWLLRERGLGGQRPGEPGGRLRPVPCRIAGARRGGDRARRHPALPDPGAGARLVDGSPPRPRARARAAEHRTKPGRGVPAVARPDPHGRDGRVLVGARVDDRRRPGRGLMAGGRGGLPHRGAPRRLPWTRRRPRDGPGCRSCGRGAHRGGGAGPPWRSDGPEASH